MSRIITVDIRKGNEIEVTELHRHPNSRGVASHILLCEVMLANRNILAEP